MKTIEEALKQVNEYLQKEFERGFLTSTQAASHKLSECLGPIGTSVPYMIPSSGDIEIASVTMKIRKKKIRVKHGFKMQDKMTVNKIELTKGVKETPLMFLATQIKANHLAKELNERNNVDNEIITFFDSMPEGARDHCLKAIGRWNKLSYESKMKIESWSEDGSVDIEGLLELKRNDVDPSKSRPFKDLSKEELDSRYLMERRFCANSVEKGLVPDKESLNLLEQEVARRS